MPHSRTTTPRGAHSLPHRSRSTFRNAADAAAPVRSARSRARNPIVGLAAMAAAGMMALSLSVPALAVTTEATTGETVPVAGVTRGQSLAAASTELPVLPRDGFTVTEKPAPIPVSAPPALAAAVAAAPIPANDALRWPVPNAKVSGGFGPREAPCAGCSTFHKGMDLTPGEGTPIVVMADGVVREVSASDNGGLGVYAVVDHVIDGQTITSVYGHMQAGSLQVGAGQSVGVGQQLGNVGNTGQSTGAHLHFEIHLDGTTPTDPMAWLVAHGAV